MYKVTRYVTKFRPKSFTGGRSLTIITIMGFYVRTKGQMKSKADWPAVNSPKKQTNEFDLFAFLLFTANKTNSFVCFLGESTAHQSALWFYLTINRVILPWHTSWREAD